MLFKPTLAKGFTLIEVLIAAVVLFAVVTSALMTFQVSLAGTKKASDKLLLLAHVGVVQQHIQKAINDAQLANPKGALEGKNRLLDVSFTWQAELESAAPPPDKFEPESTRFVRYEDRYLLYRVTLNMQYQTVTADYTYLELAILPNVKELQ